MFTVRFSPYAALLLVPLLQISFLVGHNNEFVFIVPSYNNEKYAIENLKSLCWQKSTHPYQIIYINDCSTDKTGEVVENYVKKHNLESTVTVIHNKERLGSGIANIYNAIHTLVDDDKIVAIVDGDDLLPHNDVLLVLESYYENPDVWMAYSKLKYYPRGGVMGERVQKWIIKENRFKPNTIRKHMPWLTALRTFRAGLFKKIKKEDLCYQGKFMTVSWDHAFCRPMLEMCASKCSIGLTHCAFIDKILYLYRNNSPLHDFRTKSRLQREVELSIRRLEPYEPLKDL